MHYLALQITLFLLFATISGVALGWWIKSMITNVQIEDSKNQNASDHRNLKDAREQLIALQAEHKHAQQQIHKYSAHYNSNTYGEYLETRKSLELARKENESLLADLNQQKFLINKLQHELEQENKVSDYQQEYAKDTAITSKQAGVTISVDDDENYSDDLKAITGITTNIERQLNSLGILKYRQIAEFSLQDAEMVSSHLEESELPDYNFLVTLAKGLYIDKHKHQAA